MDASSKQETELPGWFQQKIDWLIRFCWLATLGILLLFASTMVEQENTQGMLMLAGVLCIIPVLFSLAFLPIWHWKERYVGHSSTLWGVLLIMEVSGWFKIVYWFRHMVPDMLRRGRYFSRDA